MNVKLLLGVYTPSHQMFIRKRLDYILNQHIYIVQKYITNSCCLFFFYFLSLSDFCIILESSIIMLIWDWNMLVCETTWGGDVRSVSPKRKLTTSWQRDDKQRQTIHPQHYILYLLSISRFFFFFFFYLNRP